MLQFFGKWEKGQKHKGQSESALSQFLNRCCNGWVYICAHPKHKAGVLRSHFAAKYLKYCDRKLDKTAPASFFFPSVNCRRGAAAAGGEMQCNALARDRVPLALRRIAIEMQ